MTVMLFRLDLDFTTRQLVGTVRSHTDVSHHLSQIGEIEYVYEVWKDTGLHSRWCWKPKKERWGRMATPSKKSGNN